jgi:threonine dehydrogenase-like Zn-dependent dehydrogenase
MYIAELGNTPGSRRQLSCGENAPTAVGGYSLESLICEIGAPCGSMRPMFLIPRTMRAVVYRGPNDLRLETVPVPRVGPQELLVRVAVCGVCPTDIKKIQYGAVPPPRIFGHETAGTIVRAGARVRRFNVGERVALHHHVPCLECHACRHHAFAQCAQYKRTGVTAGFGPAGGGYAEYVRVMPFVLPGVVSIPPRNSFLEGAMLEPVNTVLKAIKRLALLRGDTVLVAGQGPIGLIFTRLLALQGMRVVATDLLPTRLKLAREFGAAAVYRPKSKVQGQETEDRGQRSEDRGQKTEVSNAQHATRTTPRSAVRSSMFDVGCWMFDVPPSPPSPSSPPSPLDPHLSALIHQLTGGRGPDAAVIAVPSDTVVREAQALVRGGGQVLLFAHTQRGDQTAVDLATVCVDEKDLIGSYSADFRLQAEVARLVFSRKLDARRLITHQFPLAQTAAAIELASHPTADSLKVVVVQGE